MSRVSRGSSRGPSREEIARFQLSVAAQEQINRILDKDDDGTLTPEEQQQLDELMLLNDVVTLMRSRIPDDQIETK